jgi:dihydroorotase
MKYDYILKGGTIVNEGVIQVKDIAISDGKIARIDNSIGGDGQEINVEGNLIIPGIIDDQVHFREPGLTHKADIYSESRAAVAGGTTTFMEMPNTKPPSLTIELLEDKYAIASRTSLANYSFYMGISNDNLEEALKADSKRICGLKAFMGSSTGNMLVDDPVTLDNLFRNAHMLIATHCEDEVTIRENERTFYDHYGEKLSALHHPMIRSREGCYLSSSLAVRLAKKYDSRLHILHISTADELDLFDNDIDRKEKRITAEACVHHLTFNDAHYHELGNLIKCNPAIKKERDRAAIFEAVLDGRIDVIATDHAPHTLGEKEQHYLKAPSGLPLVQHSLNLMLNKVHGGELSMGMLVDKMCHAPADLFQIKERGYLREGYWADIVQIDMNSKWTVSKSNLLYKCGWSPIEGWIMKGEVKRTFVSGNLAYENGKLLEGESGQRIEFERA